MAQILDSLLLFYSINCGHCRMLLDSITRYDKNKLVKNICIETLISENRLPEQIHSVPAMFIKDKGFLYGKAVFDFLLLPGTGKLVSQETTNVNNTNNTNNSIAPNKLVTTELDEPLGFSMAMSGLSDGFSSIEDIENDLGSNDRRYNWTPVDNSIEDTTNFTSISVNQDARTKKELPSLSDLQEQRSLDMNKPLNVNPNNIPNAISSR